ncbi:hypothetical protein PVAND_015399 [Polypedilum vanderplanki]|uniref:MD-2-related lipid-recognition domain-containing protein n=1 Tax=Polypedilum vanderplanki TaxID=319348 RepID=A0A9J6BCI5_POLVA|nr:hypothetical protein PVAND_015399 [Polypedilum vanderplanki]
MWKIVISVLLLSSFATASFWSACENNAGVAPDDVVSPSCSGSICHGVRGERLIANVTFTPRANHNDLRVQVWATVLGIQIPLPGEPPHDNACNNIFHNNVRQSCPVVGGRQYLWIIEMDIPLTLPALNNARVRYEIWDGDVEVMCASIVAQLL